MCETCGCGKFVVAASPNAEEANKELDVAAGKQKNVKKAVSDALNAADAKQELERKIAQRELEKRGK